MWLPCLATEAPSPAAEKESITFRHGGVAADDAGKLRKAHGPVADDLCADIDGTIPETKERVAGEVIVVMVAMDDPAVLFRDNTGGVMDKRERDAFPPETWSS